MPGSSARRRAGCSAAGWSGCSGCYEPRRLWRRYLRNNPLFVWHLLLQTLGLRRYDVDAGPELSRVGSTDGEIRTEVSPATPERETHGWHIVTGPDPRTRQT